MAEYDNKRKRNDISQRKAVMKNKYHEINNEIEIDFEIPEMLRNLIEEAEEADIRNDGSYDNLADTIDVLSKNYYADKKLTLEQWETIVRRYPQ